eukprot:TRINITY_DN4645_c0_g1_i5.p1 TRINITY_DN4645_c0_g1~~TRINITY_DN4645_c0_g1_i5.p1  ORF type:complete len:156 (-),score=9.88 TRINITY_DN4645_c0_g1_i5:40-450(-)
MNDNKTEIMPVGTAMKLKSLSGTSSFKLTGIYIPFSHKVRNLGVMLDSSLTMENHINAVCKSVFLQLHRISYIRKYVSVTATQTLSYQLLSFHVWTIVIICWLASQTLNLSDYSEHITKLLGLFFANVSGTMSLLS